MERAESVGLTGSALDSEQVGLAVGETIVVDVVQVLFVGHHRRL